MQVGRVLRVSLFKGCILGGVVGDALGMPLEGWSRNQIREKFGRVDNYVQPYRKTLGLRQWTDDTALTKATLESIIEKKGINLEDLTEKLRIALRSEPWRGWGKTTQKALEFGQPSGKSLGNGAAMRIAPVALFLWADFESLKEQVAKVSALTHTHALAIEGAQAIAFALAFALHEDFNPQNLITKTISFVGENSEISYKLWEVKELLENKEITSEEALDQIGTRGIILDTVGSVFYCFLKTPKDFYNSIVTAINAGGDTDTIGSLVGALSGAYNGIENIPHKWLSSVEAREELEDLALHLYQLSEELKLLRE